MPGAQLRGDFVADADIQIDALLDQIDQPVLNVQTDIQLRITRGQFRQRRRDETPAKALAADDPQQATRLAMQGSHFVAHLLH